MATKRFAAGAAAILALGLAACVDVGTGATGPAVVGDGGDPSLPDIAGANCIRQLSQTANRPVSQIRVARVEVGARGPVHYLEIDGAAAPWVCKTLPNGAVTDLYYSAEG
ncbi:hypothetical protein DXV76_20780 [Rhodobacteraceae bacterium CCMM004]|nr:hypothetical protein DXV76_20780 [Rhodobacteraceae bacterium CCMM004]